MRNFRLALSLGIAALTVAGATLALASVAKADECDRLWYKRNAIYAEAGYCFKTPRARAVFGRNCFPPYGQLGPYAQRRVNEIQAEEDDLGCPR